MGSPTETVAAWEIGGYRRARLSCRRPSEVDALSGGGAIDYHLQLGDRSCSIHLSSSSGIAYPTPFTTARSNGGNFGTVKPGKGMNVPAASPAPPENGFQAALRKFEIRLKPEEKAKCKVATLDELKTAVLAIQDEQRRRRELINMRRIQGFLEAMEQFGKVIEVFTNSSEMVAFIWGPMKLLLLVSIFQIYQLLGGDDLLNER